MPKENRVGGLRILSAFLRTARWVAILGLGALIAFFAVDFIINLLFVNPGRLDQFLVIRVIREISEPIAERTISMIRFKTRVRGIEFMPLIIAALLYLVMDFLNRQTVQLIAVVETEYELRQVRIRKSQHKSIEGLTFSSTSTDKARRGFFSRLVRRKEEERDRLLREFAEVKKRLEKTRQRLAFLSVDIVGSTRIKVGQDPLLSERLFREYRLLLEGIFKRFRYRAASWTPDGVMVCFSQVDLAAEAAKELLKRLPAFNRERNPLSFLIQVRCGLNAGEVNYDERTPLELLSDRVLDITGHLQKAARPDTLLVTEDIYRPLRDKKGWTGTDKEVDEYKVFEWARAETDSVSQAALTKGAG